MFNKQNFCHVASNNRNEQKAGLFLYKTTDDLDTVTTSGYFNDKIIDINLHDLIIHEWHDPSDKTKVQQNLLCVIERTLDNVGTTVIKSKWEGVVDEFMEHGLGTDFVKLDGTSVMTGPLKMANGSMRGAFSPYLNGVGFFKMDAQGVLTQIATLSDTQFLPATTSAIDLGSNTKKWKNLYLTAYEYIDNTDNNGQSLRFVNYVSGTSTIMGIERYSSSYPQAFIHFNTNPERIEIQGHSGSTGDGILCISGSGGWLENSGTSRYWGNVSYPWDIIYTTKLNNGADVVVPNQAGTMLVADSTGATQGQVLTLDNNLKPAWANPSGGGGYYPDLFDWKWRDATTSRTDWALSDGNWINQADATTAYSHLVDDFDNVNVKQIEYRDGGVYLFNRYATGDTEHNDVLYYAWQNTLTPTSIVYTTTENPSIGDDIYNNAFSVTESVYAIYKSSTETIAGTTITYYQATDGHKIVLADQETNANAIYTATGVAWYYILDNANQRFKLPRAKPLSGGVAGNGMTLGLTNGTTNAGLARTTPNGSYLNGESGNYGSAVSTTGATGTGVISGIIGVTTDGTKSGIIAERDNTDQCKYLYFYVG